MKKNLKRIVLLVLALLSVFLNLPVVYSENTSEYVNPTIVLVTANRLNGRANPRKTGFVEARFDQGDELLATGEWSEDHKWIEVVGGETGTVWVYADYVSERKSSYLVKNIDYRTVKIRSRPFDGKVTGYVGKGRTIEILRVVLGWGRTKKGWVDLFYLEEMD